MDQNNDLYLSTITAYAIIKSLPLIGFSLFLLILAWTLSQAFILFSLFMAVTALYRFLYIRSHRYHITSETIRLTKGLFWKTSAEHQLYHLRDYTLIQGAAMRLCGALTLCLKSEIAGQADLILRGIAMPEIVEQLKLRISALRAQKPQIDANLSS